MSIDLPSPWLDRVVTFWLHAGKRRVLALAGLAITAIALADWQIGLDISLGVLYVVPMVIGATVLTSRSVLVLAFLCAVLRRLFENAISETEASLRFAFALIAYAGAGLTVVAVMRNRAMAVEHLATVGQEQTLRNQAEEQLRTLVESSPAGILTLDRKGTVLAANQAVNPLFGLAPHESMKGRSIDRYLPVLADALRLNSGDSPFRTSAQTQGSRQNGELFLADIWFSTYAGAEGKRLAAIVIDSSDEMREREETNLRQLATNSRIMAGAMLHEVRNLCAAISTVYANSSNGAQTVGEVCGPGVDHLKQALAGIASLELHYRESHSLEAVSLKEVLDDLRIIIEPGWLEMSGEIRWNIADDTPRVLADRHGLLQVFLNLAQNSQRAVPDAPVRELEISVSAAPQRVQVSFRDTGHGIADPSRLFRPFESGSDSTGLGLYISRSLLRGYGGELRFLPQDTGACFVAELLPAPARRTA